MMITSCWCCDDDDDDDDNIGIGMKWNEWYEFKQTNICFICFCMYDVIKSIKLVSQNGEWIHSIHSSLLLWYIK